MRASALVLLCLLSVPVTSSEIIDISDAIQWLLRSNPKHIMSRHCWARDRLSGWIVAAARESRIDPALLTAKAFLESTFRPDVTGTRGEVGLVQVGPHVRGECQRDGYDMAVPLDQLRCGARHLRRMINRCGSLRGGLTAYGSAPPRCREIEGDRVWRAVNIRMAKMSRLKARPWQKRGNNGP